jgi:hypothetical protein
MISAQAIGGIAGGLLAASRGNRAGTARTLGCAAMVFGGLDLALLLYPWRGPRCGPAPSSSPPRDFRGPS